VSLSSIISRDVNLFSELKSPFLYFSISVTIFALILRVYFFRIILKSNIRHRHQQLVCTSNILVIIGFLFIIVTTSLTWKQNKTTRDFKILFLHKKMLIKIFIIIFKTGFCTSLEKLWYIVKILFFCYKSNNDLLSKCWCIYNIFCYDIKMWETMIISDGTIF